MKIMISQPMQGKTTEEVRAEREAVISKLEAQGHEVLNTIFTNAPPETPRAALWYLGQAISAMSEADALYLMAGWRQARGCIIEKAVAEKYDVQVIIQAPKGKERTKKYSTYGVA